MYLTLFLLLTGKKRLVAVVWVTMRVALMPSFLLLPLFFLLASEKSSAVAEQQCRTRGVFLEPKEFTAETCATCYIYVHKDKFKSAFHKWNTIPRNVTQMPLKATKLTNGTHEVSKKTYLKLILKWVIF